MNLIYNTILIVGILLISLFGSCAQNKTETIINDGLQATTQPDSIVLPPPNMDTVRVTNEHLDEILTSEFDTKLFARLIVQKVPFATRKIDNPHVVVKDVLYTFTSEQAEYVFLNVTNSQQVFLIYAQGAWLEKSMSDKSGLQGKLNKILKNANLYLDSIRYTITPDAVLCVSSSEDFTTITYNYKDSELDSFTIDKWVD